MIEMRRLKIQDIKRSVDPSKKNADREKAGGVRVLNSLKDSIERGLNELLKTIEEKQQTKEKQADVFTQELEQEISKLMKRSRAEAALKTTSIFTRVFGP